MVEATPVVAPEAPKVSMADAVKGATTSAELKGIAAQIPVDDADALLALGMQVSNAAKMEAMMEAAEAEAAKAATAGAVVTPTVSAAVAQAPAGPAPVAVAAAAPQVAVAAATPDISAIINAALAAPVAPTAEAATPLAPKGGFVEMVKQASHGHHHSGGKTAA